MTKPIKNTITETNIPITDFNMYNYTTSVQYIT